MYFFNRTKNKENARVHTHVIS